MSYTLKYTGTEIDDILDRGAPSGEFDEYFSEIFATLDKLNIVDTSDDYSTVSGFILGGSSVAFSDGNGGFYPYAGTFDGNYYFARVAQGSDDTNDANYEVAYIDTDGNWSVGNGMALAPLYSPTFTGNPKAPTPPASSDSTAIATTEFVHDAVDPIAEAVNAAYVTDTAEGSIASFSDGADNIPVKDLTAQIVLKQDLHGQSAPYPAGGGANKWDEQWEVGGINQETGANATASNTIRAKNICVCSPSTTYYLGTNVSAIYWYGVNDAYIGFDYNNASGNVRTSPSTATGFRILVKSSYGTTYHNDIAVNYPSTVTTYSPYSNICPISGWTGATIARAGKNLYDASTTTTGSWIAADGTIGSSASFALSDYIPVSGDEVTISGNTGGWGASPAVCFFDRSKNHISGTHPTTNPVTLTIPAGAAFMRTSMSVGSKDTLQVELTGTASTFEAYNGTTYPIDFGQTVYGGTLDATTGVLTVTHASVDMGSLNWGYNSTYNCFRANDLNGICIAPSAHGDESAICSMFARGDFFVSSGIDDGKFVVADSGWSPTTSSVVAKDTAYTDADLFKTAVTGQTLVYALATPTTIQLSPTEVKTLLGDNNVWADTGEVEVEYRADTKLYIAKVIGGGNMALSMAAPINRTAILRDEVDEVEDEGGEADE